ncbi:MAG: phosphatase PAP2 family protein [FCB group bacterium]|nr:phosphatase PAP2 family protein [FCB group bacterium]
MKKTIMISICFLSLGFAQFNNADYVRFAMPEIAKTWEGYVMLGGGAALSGAATFADRSVQTWMTEKQHLPSWMDKLGDLYVDHYWAFGVSLLGAVGKGYQTGHYLEPLRYWTFSNLGTIGLTYLLKYSVGRERPNAKNNYSYPSGHSSVAFATATMYQMWYGWKAGVPAYALAVLTAFQRLDDNQHWFSDVIMGTTIGIVVPYMFYKGEERAKSDDPIPLALPISVSIPFNFPVGK